MEPFLNHYFMCFKVAGDIQIRIFKIWLHFWDESPAPGRVLMHLSNTWPSTLKKTLFWIRYFRCKTFCVPAHPGLAGTRRLRATTSTSLPSSAICLESPAMASSRLMTSWSSRTSKTFNIQLSCMSYKSKNRKAYRSKIFIDTYLTWRTL